MARAIAAEGRLFETLIRNKKACQRNAGRRIKARTTVLMVFLLAFWRWLLPAPAMQAPWPLSSVSPAADPAVRRHARLAPIPVPSRRLLS
jgi:hypothetical protein